MRQQVPRVSLYLVNRGIRQRQIPCDVRYFAGKVFRDARYLASQNGFWKKYFATQGIFISAERGADKEPPTLRQRYLECRGILMY